MDGQTDALLDVSEEVASDPVEVRSVTGAGRVHRVSTARRHEGRHGDGGRQEHRVQCGRTNRLSRNTVFPPLRWWRGKAAGGWR